MKQRFTIERNQPVEKQLVLDELAYKVDIPAAAIHDDVGKCKIISTYYVSICDAIKQNESEVENMIFDVLAFSIKILFRL